MAVTTRKYNPGFFSDEELMESFCVRTMELESLVEVLRQCTGSANQHQIVIGPRGSGKTTLLLRVAAEARRDDMLAANCLPIVFSEESYEVSTAGEFWLECLTLLADQAPEQEDGTDLHRTVKELRAVRDDRMLGDRCLAALLDFADRLDKRLLLLVENLNMLFRDMTDIDAGWRLRKVLQTEPRIIMFASATSRFKEIDHPEYALYHFFRVRTLHPLNTRECETLWERTTGKKPASNTIRSLEILTGGSPRLLVIVARFAVARSFRPLMADLLDLVDDHTEYFRSHLGSLAVQERRVYLALATLWKPATAREVANQARLDTSKCSSQLARLKDRGMVDVTNNSARRKQYYLTERLYNIYYLLRRRRADSIVEALIIFMEAFYSLRELKEIADKESECLVDKDSDLIRSLKQSILKRLCASPVFGSDSKGLETELVIKEKLKTVRALIDEGRLENALASCDEIELLFRGNENPAVVQVFIRVLLYKGEILNMLSRHEEALDACDQAIQRFGDSKAPDILGSVAIALVNKAGALLKLNRYEEVLDICDQVVQPLGDGETPFILELLAFVMVFKGYALLMLSRHEEALDVCDQVIQGFEGSEIPFILSPVTFAMATKCRILSASNRYEEALAAYEEIIARFGESDFPTLRVGVLFVELLLEKAAITLAESDVKEALSFLPEEEIFLSRRNIRTLLEIGIDLGPRSMSELIRESPSKNLLLPLTTALERELGNEPRVAKEVLEVAQDIQRQLEEMRGGRKRQQHDLRVNSTEAVRNRVEKRKATLEMPQA